MAQVAYIINEPSVMEFMKLLNAPGFQSQRQDFSALIDYISTVEKQYNSILNELSTLKEQVSGIKDKKNPLAVMVLRTQETASDLGERLGNLKDSIINFTKNALETIKDKGLTALNSVFSFLKIKDGLQAMSDSLDNAFDNAEKSIQKIDAMSREYHEMGNRAANIGRVFMGNETSDEVKENGIIAKALQLPYLALQNAYIAIDTAVTNAADKLQSLEDYIAINPSLLAKVESNLDKLSPAQLQNTYTKLLDMGMNTDLSAEENTTLQGLISKIDTMLPQNEISNESEILALEQGAEI